ncbi:expressed unknown protein [Seminavis robusta]|uniref:Amino acid transporter transmembrane domain-containing protein n=1 Tax=Seminavis robusta TaxID=568900 RepID=A0A9N8EQR8_9STRA|nr:expressed unknown protein [Seminavis robusta]|eukprot:Sro1693_g291640.1 n/a (652) ;mRNA; f:9844-11929
MEGGGAPTTITTSYIASDDGGITSLNASHKSPGASSNHHDDDIPMSDLSDHQSAAPASDDDEYHCLEDSTTVVEDDNQSTMMVDISQKVQSSNITAFVTLLKALFGVSLLSSPRVLGETGLVLGVLVYSLIVTACMGSCWCLLQARDKVATASSSSPETSTTATRPSLLTATSSSISATTTLSANAITYGDLGLSLLGVKQSVMINFLIVSLHICFGAGLVSSSMHQIAIVLGWDIVDDQYSDSQYENNNDSQEEEGEEEEEQQDAVWMAGRWILAAILFPLISALLQFRNIKGLFWVCFAGLLVFLVGCVGTMVYSTILVDNDGDGSLIWDLPDDAFVFKWGGIPDFVASTLCAMEGINLALPIANSYLASATLKSENKNYQSASAEIPKKSLISVVTSAIGAFGAMTLLISIFGYSSGLGGGEGTKYDKGSDDDNADCRTVAYCLDSELLSNVHRLSLAAALILTLPIILYPSLEMIEKWAEERHRQLKHGKTSSGQTVGSSWNGFVFQKPPETLQRKLQIEEFLFGTEPYFPGLHRHWRYRIAHASAVCLLAIADRPWNRALVLYKGVGLSIACFVLPVMLYIRASTLPVILAQPGLAAALAGLTTLGLVNLVLVFLSVFTEHNYLPTELHEGPPGPHHGEEEEAAHF